MGDPLGRPQGVGESSRGLIWIAVRAPGRSAHDSARQDSLRGLFEAVSAAGYAPLTQGQIDSGLALATGSVRQPECAGVNAFAYMVAAFCRHRRAKPTHIITCDQTAADVYASQMYRVLSRCGLRVGKLAGASTVAERGRIYGSDVVVGAFREYMLDWLRDDFAETGEQLIQGRAIPSLAIVDGIDLLLVEAGTASIRALLDGSVTHRITLLQYLQEYERVAGSRVRTGRPTSPGLAMLRMHDPGAPPTRSMGAPAAATASAEPLSISDAVKAATSALRAGDAVFFAAEDRSSERLCSALSAVGVEFRHVSQTNSGFPESCVVEAVTNEDRVTIFSGTPPIPILGDRLLRRLKSNSLEWRRLHVYVIGQWSIPEHQAVIQAWLDLCGPPAQMTVASVTNRRARRPGSRPWWMPSSSMFTRAERPQGQDAEAVSKMQRATIAFQSVEERHRRTFFDRLRFVGVESGTLEEAAGAEAADLVQQSVRFFASLIEPAAVSAATIDQLLRVLQLALSLPSKDRWLLCRDAYVESLRVQWPRHLRTLDALWLNPADPDAPHRQALADYRAAADESARHLLEGVLSTCLRRLERLS